MSAPHRQDSAPSAGRTSPQPVPVIHVIPVIHFAPVSTARGATTVAEGVTA